MATACIIARMAHKKKPRIKEPDITGLKYFDKLAPLLERLHDDGCERDRAGNRKLHYDQYCMLILLYLFNPVVTSLRGIQQASELKKVQTKLGCPRASLGSLSEATSVFDPERLQGDHRRTGEQLKPFARDARLKDIHQTHDAGRRLAAGSVAADDGGVVAQSRRRAAGWSSGDCTRTSR